MLFARTHFEQIVDPQLISKALRFFDNKKGTSVWGHVKKTPSTAIFFADTLKSPRDLELN